MKHLLTCALLALSFASAAHAAPPKSRIQKAKEAAAKKKAAARKSTPKKAAPKKGTPKKAAAKKATTKRRGKEMTTIPIDVGIGPAVHMITGPVQDDQQLHYGIKFNVKAIISGALIKKNLHKVPRQYRKYVKGVKEARIGHLLIPDTFFISPKSENTGLYGLNWRPLQIEMVPIRVPRLSLGIGIDISYIYIDMDRPTAADPAKTENVTTHFLRPGADLHANFEVPLSDSFLVSVGWQSTFYPPQELGGKIFALGEVDDSIWHIGQAYLKFHFRIPYTTAI